MDLQEVYVLRLGHRFLRDKRITSHLALAARALGARGVFIHGDHDQNLMRSIQKVVMNWGGDFKVEFVSDWRALIRRWKGESGLVVHLTMYGLPFEKYIDVIRKDGQRILLLVGGKKVPWDAYELADFNLSVTSQPHSEISALSIFLDRLYQGKELELKFRRPRYVVSPSPRGKVVLRRKEEEKRPPA